MTLDYYIFSSPGGREYNEDSTDMKADGASAAFVLADGLGGHRCGELASRCVVDTVLSVLPQSQSEDKSAALQESLTQANEQVLLLQREKAARMKSTAVVLYLDGSDAYWAHVGDSRLYRIHDNKLTFVTEDHSVAYKKYKAGEITRAQIAFDEDQSSLLRALGNPGEVRPDFGAAPIEHGDAYLLCSDGLWEYLHDEEVLLDYLKTSDARDWAELMLLRVMERIPSGNDNLSLITVRT